MNLFLTLRDASRNVNAVKDNSYSKTKKVSNISIGECEQ